MILYTNGCSFTYGDELQNPTEQRWSKLLADELKYDLICDAKNGQSNQDIMVQTLKHTDIDLAVIQLTTFLRPKMEGTIELYYQFIHQMQKHFVRHDIQYVFLNAWDNQDWIDYSDPQAEQLNLEHFIGFPDNGIVEWVYGLPKCPKGHPGKEAQHVISDKIHEHLLDNP